MKVAVIGASNKPDRYSYKAVMLLKENGHTVYPVHKKLQEIEGIKVYASIGDVETEVDTVCLYVGSDISSSMAEDIILKKPRRLIFSPGAENPDLEAKAKESGILTVNGCTLVMLNTGQF